MELLSLSEPPCGGGGEVGNAWLKLWSNPETAMVEMEATVNAGPLTYVYATSSLCECRFDKIKDPFQGFGS